MTSLTRKIAAATIAAATALSIAGLGVASATADEVTADTTTGTLTVSSANAEFAGKTVTAWQMFTATPDATGENAGYQVATGWDEFFKGADVLNDSSLSGDVLNEKAADYVRKLGEDDNANVTAFAKKAADWAKKQTGLTKTEAKASDTATDGKYTATFTGLSFGYYVVSPASGSTSSTRGTDAILVNVTKDTQDINLKSTYPTVDKKVDNDNHSSAQIGDTVNFTLTSAVPDTSEYGKYTFKFVDTLSKGLTFNNDVTVKVGETTLTPGDNGYYVTSTANDDGTTTLTIDLSSSIKQQTAGAAITVTYSATLNENAVIGGTTDSNAGNTNSVKVVYSNNPGTDETGESKPSITHTYAFDFDLKKVSVAKDEQAQALAGAEFQLKDKDGNVIKLVKTGATDKDTYRPAKTGEAGEGVVETVTTPASGIIAFTGLKAGEYQLVETKAPAGYNKLPAPITVTITATYNDDGTLNNYTVKYNGKDASGHEITVENHKGTLLPETGGMGTMLFTVLGVLVVALGAAWYVRSERKGAVRA